MLSGPFPPTPFPSFFSPSFPFGLCSLSYPFSPLHLPHDAPFDSLDSPKKSDFGTFFSVLLTTQGEATHQKKPAHPNKNSSHKLFLPVSAYFTAKGRTICTNCSEIVCANCAFIWVGVYLGGFPLHELQGVWQLHCRVSCYTSTLSFFAPDLYFRRVVWEQGSQRKVFVASSEAKTARIVPGGTRKEKPKNLFKRPFQETTSKGEKQPHQSQITLKVAIGELFHNFFSQGFEK